MGASNSDGPCRGVAADADVRRGLRELTEICEQGQKSNWPSRDPWQNGDAWQNTYIALWVRIIDGRVDVNRPLGPLARLAAKRFFLSERRRQSRFAEMTDEHLHRSRLGEEREPDEEVELARRADALRDALLDRVRADELSESDLTILFRRYVEDWDAREVADAAGLSVENVRQVCSRRCRMLRQALVNQGLATLT